MQTYGESGESAGCETCGEKCPVSMFIAVD